jgi:hypothetical protein
MSDAIRFEPDPANPHDFFNALFTPNTTQIFSLRDVAAEFQQYIIAEELAEVLFQTELCSSFVDDLLDQDDLLFPSVDELSFMVFEGFVSDFLSDDAEFIMASEAYKTELLPLFADLFASFAGHICNPAPS